MENKKSTEQIAYIARVVANILSDNDCTVEEADDVLRITSISIHNSATVPHFELPDC